MATTPIPAKRGRKPAAATAQQAGGQVQSLTRGLKLLEWIAESHSSVALTELAQQAADAVLLQDNLHGVIAARELSLEAMKLVNSNIKLTEWINSAIMLAAALGWLSPGASAMLHNGTTLGVLLRSLAAKKASHR